jgi:hypothetical protein
VTLKDLLSDLQHHRKALLDGLRIWRLGVRFPRGVHETPGQWPGAVCFACGFAAFHTSTNNFSIVRSPASSNPSMPGRALLYDLDRGR